MILSYEQANTPMTDAELLALKPHSEGTGWPFGSVMEGEPPQMTQADIDREEQLSYAAHARGDKVRAQLHWLRMQELFFHLQEQEDDECTE